MPGFRSLSALQHRYASKPKNRASSLSESGNRLRMTISHKHLKDPRSIVNRAVLTLQLRQCTSNHTSGEGSGVSNESQLSVVKLLAGSELGERCCLLVLYVITISNARTDLCLDQAWFQSVVRPEGRSNTFKFQICLYVSNRNPIYLEPYLP
jgi:hypothetical protein